MRGPSVFTTPIELHPDTQSLVERFASALADKLYRAQVKRAFTNAQLPDDWKREDWEADCRADLLHHVAKGDPLDVAAYCAFMWHHGWLTALPVLPQAPDSEQICTAFAATKNQKFMEGADQ